MIGSSASLSVLHRNGRAASLLMLAIVPAQILLYVLFPPPGSASGWLDLFASSPLQGLIGLDLLYILNNALLILIYLSLWDICRQTSPGGSLTALVLGLTGIAAYFGSNPAFEMLNLSRRWSLVSSSAGEAAVLGAAEALLAGYTGTAFNAYYLLNDAALWIFAVILYRSNAVGRRVAVAALVSALFMLVPSSFGTPGIVASLLSLPPWCLFLAWMSVHMKKFSLQKEDL